MSSNTIHARVAFSFKAESYELESTIDLDRHLGEDAPNFHLILAKAGGIDPYSYLFEALESYEIEFSEPAGIAVACCHEGMFDWPRFRGEALEASDFRVVGPIAERILGVSDLDAHPDLKAALLAAYRAGKADGTA